jgi:hypothetical protein
MARNNSVNKDMSSLREADIAKVQKEKGHGELRDYTLQHRVHLYWDLSDDAIRDKMFRLVIDDYEVILDTEQMMRYLRWV